MKSALVILFCVFLQWQNSLLAQSNTILLFDERKEFTQYNERNRMLLTNGRDTVNLEDNFFQLEQVRTRLRSDTLSLLVILDELKVVFLNVDKKYFLYPPEINSMSIRIYDTAPAEYLANLPIQQQLIKYFATFNCSLCEDEYISFEPISK